MDKLQQQLAKVRNLLDVTFFRVLLFIMLGIVLYLSMYNNVKPEKLNLNLFSVATETIRSPVTVSDKESTERKKEEAEAQVKDVYVLKTEINENRVDLITSIFDSAIEVNRDIENAMKPENASEDNEFSKNDPPTSAEKVTMLKEKLTVDVAEAVSDSTFLSLVTASPENLGIAKDLTVTAIHNIMRNTISADQVENGKKRVEEELKYTNLDTGLKNAAVELGRYAIMQNEFFDVEATQELRQQARESVDPVKILQGQIIVEENQLINREIYRQLELVGLLDNENSYLPFIGLLLLIGILLGALYYYFYEMNVKSETKQTYLLLFSIIFLLSIILLKGISLMQQIEYSEIGYVFPAAMGAMLIRILIDERIALLWTAIMAICGSIMFNQGITSSLNVEVGIYMLCSGIAAVLYLSKQNQRAKILQAGVFISFVNLVVIFSLVLMKNGQYNALEYSFHFLAAFISGITSAVLTMGLLPFFEAGFGILSTMRLIELSNPNHPLIRKILTEAPGTYHHSVMVANLSESACEAIGANGLLARVGCYYHDIGKTNRPQFFIENQMNIDNPHDRLPPQTSKNIIIAHAVEGAEILRKYRLPKEIIDIAEQHHGTTLLKFFYHKAQQNGLEVDEKDYRYPGPKAQTKETAIIGIADSVEAAVRSMSSPNPEKIEGLVRNIIADRLQDGQLNECDLTLKELEIVANTFCETLKGIFHSRIEYPEMSKQKVKQA
ncbi:HD family phosphohydrolase [Bacillus dakarensis]|uniref:HD family phosphohydrolase n=1 Tax=Robertmurraya dakarensis TaxID=1926278 RepID=UPI00098163C3|nr:HD family phosphohydrolase [Bacillus dakarensis]